MSQNSDLGPRFNIEILKLVETFPVFFSCKIKTKTKIQKYDKDFSQQNFQEHTRFQPN